MALAYQATGNLERAIEVEREVVTLALARGVADPTEFERRLLEMLWEMRDPLLVGEVYYEMLMQRLSRLLVPPAEAPDPLSALSRSLIEQGRLKEAEDLARECLAVRTEALPQTHWLIADGTILLGNVLAKRGEFEDAEKHLLDGLKLLEQSPQVSDKYRYETVMMIADMYGVWGQTKNAEKWRLLLAKFAPPKEEKQEKK
ncbi:MAG: tetratricopeptide repeat protein [Planctomycetota bacterium]